MLSLGSSSCVSPRWLSEEFLVQVCSRCSHLGIVLFRIGFVSGSLVFGVSVLHVEYRLVLLEMLRLLGTHAWLGSGYMFCISSGRF